MNELTRMSSRHCDPRVLLVVRTVLFVLFTSGLVFSQTAAVTPAGQYSLAQIAIKPLSAAEERGMEPGQVFKECEHCPEMIVVPSGEFMMGAPETEEGSTANERPQHKVTIARPFAVGRFSVTFEEWDACVADGGCKWTEISDRGWGRGLQPVINIRWEEARAYVWWLAHNLGDPTDC
jgi:formylglycine-generating enzyme required for sulfatase activity